MSRSHRGVVTIERNGLEVAAPMGPSRCDFQLQQEVYTGEWLYHASIPQLSVRRGYWTNSAGERRRRLWVTVSHVQDERGRYLAPSTHRLHQGRIFFSPDTDVLIVRSTLSAHVLHDIDTTWRVHYTKGGEIEE